MFSTVFVMTESEITDSQRIKFGHRLRQLRRKNNWTLAEVAKRSGLAISTISKAERGIIALTYDRLALLADGLETDMAAFFAADGKTFTPGSFAVARKGEFRRQETTNYVYEMLFPELWYKSMSPMMGTLKAHELVEFDEFVRHPGQEFLVVMEGVVTVHVEGGEPVTLKQGDSIYFDSAIGHLYASDGDKDARILVVCTAPGSNPSKTSYKE